MVDFRTKNANLVKFWSVLQWKMLGHLIYFTAILWPFGIFCSHLVYFVVILVHFVVILVYFSRFGLLHKEKSGNPDTKK
jgi:hypothetical protein